MNFIKNHKLSIVLSAIILAGIGYFVHQSKPSGIVGAAGNLLAENYDTYIRYNGGFNTALPVTDQSTLSVTGAATITGAVTTGNGITYGGVLSTTTPTSITLAQSDFASYTGILMTPTVGSITITLPATSTLTSFLATTGQQASYIFCNATTTALQNITLAGGTGMNVSNATTTLVVTPKKCATLNLIRTANTDVDLLVDVGI